MPCCDVQVAAEVLEIMAPKERREADGGRGDASGEEGAVCV